MNWKIKAHTMAILSRVPFGRRAFNWLQRAGRTNRLDPQEGLSRALEIVQMACDAGVAIEGAHCVEVGTGWRPYVPFLLQLIGASRTTSIDVNPWLTKKFAKETLQALSERIPEISTRTATNVKTIQARFESAQTASLYNLHRMLDALGVDYHCPGDARSTGLRAGSVDIVCSSNVLEHVPTQVLEAIHRESLRILKPGGLIVHRFNPADHFSFVDKNVTSVNFLQFSESQWHWLGGSGLSFHNRLRCKQHADLILSTGLEIVSVRQRVDARAMDQLAAGKLRLHPDYLGFSHEELAADYMWVVARRRCESG